MLRVAKIGQCLHVVIPLNSDMESEIGQELESKQQSNNKEQHWAQDWIRDWNLNNRSWTSSLLPLLAEASCLGHPSDVMNTCFRPVDVTTDFG
ncbi:hypothetical protein Tco_0781821 [Tanacetum coccineum]